MIVSESIVSPYAYVGIKGHLQIQVSKMSASLKHKTAESILFATCKYFGIESLEKMMKRNRKDEFVMARHIAAFLIKRMTGLRDAEIAVYFKRDRTTILNSLWVVQDFIDTKNENVLESIENIKAML